MNPFVFDFIAPIVCDSNCNFSNQHVRKCIFNVAIL